MGYLFYEIFFYSSFNLSINLVSKVKLYILIALKFFRLLIFWSFSFSEIKNIILASKKELKFYSFISIN
jgi:hypothetical protein